MVLGCNGCSSSSVTNPDTASPKERIPLIEFSTLLDGEFVDIQFESDGCFNHDRITFTMAAEHEATKASGFDSTVYYSDEVHGPKPANKSLDPIVLSHQDCNRLDRLLEFYRAGPESGCTTTDQVQLTMVTRSRGTLKERYEDGSCSTFESKDLLSFRALASRMGRR